MSSFIFKKTDEEAYDPTALACRTYSDRLELTVLSAGISPNPEVVKSFAGLKILIDNFTLDEIQAVAAQAASAKGIDLVSEIGVEGG